MLNVRQGRSLGGGMEGEVRVVAEDGGGWGGLRPCLNSDRGRRAGPMQSYRQSSCIGIGGEGW